MRRSKSVAGKLALKGGTVFNLFLSDVPKLLVDIDLTYVGAESRESMWEASGTCVMRHHPDRVAGLK